MVVEEADIHGIAAINVAVPVVCRGTRIHVFILARNQSRYRWERYWIVEEIVYQCTGMHSDQPQVQVGIQVREGRCKHSLAHPRNLD